MHRHITYPGQIPLETDQLYTNRHVEVETGMGWLALLGNGTSVSGLACTPTSPASLQVNIGPGSIFSYGPVDSTAYSSLAADTVDEILRQGVLINGGTTLTITPPATTGQSVNFLVEASYADTDGNPVSLPYYNSSNPAVAWTGPNNSGTPQNTVRQGLCVITLKAGTPAATGSQVTPAPDSGCVGLYVITVANGQTTITAGNISLYPGAPFITPLSQMIPASQAAGVVGSMRNAKMSVAAASASATFTADEIIVETALGGTRFCLANYSQTVNLATTGAGAMDTGAAPTSGYVALYAIWNPTTGSASILATNATSSVAPNVYGGGHMPSGYTASALISAWPTNASGQLVVGFQRDRHVTLASFGGQTFTTPQTNAMITLPIPPNAVSVDIGSSQSTATGATNYLLQIASSSPTTGGTVGSNPSLEVAGLLEYATINTVYLLTPQTVFVTWNVAGGSSPVLDISANGYAF